MAGKSLDDVSWDERSVAARNHKRQAGGMSQMKSFAVKVLKEHGMPKKAEAVEDIQILKPKRGMKYPFVS